ncbi:hypothetical protein FOZ62_023022 [Perkinsus olseni]|uniref:RNase H type-1 domain-containing protein n=1 Tax=Perkinsus olseni TaxID=32597 RepID=A0A7J6QNU1_PEROL|nr:hypothetical protein FOZ62_023022 [Perkinsus olseni]
MKPRPEAQFGHFSTIFVEHLKKTEIISARRVVATLIHIYTDGSRGVQLHTAHWRLPSLSSTTKCELYAVEKAARWVVVRLHWVLGHSGVEGNEGNEVASQLAAQGGSLSEPSGEARTLTRYLKERMRIATRFRWSVERSRLALTAIKDVFFCASRTPLWIHREVTRAASAVVFGSGVVQLGQCQFGQWSIRTLPNWDRGKSDTRVKVVPSRAPQSTI